MTVRAIGKPAGAKLLRVDAELESGTIVSISIRGDFFAHPEEGFERAESRLAGCPVAGLAGRFDALLAEEGVEAVGISGAALAEVLQGGIDAASV